MSETEIETVRMPVDDWIDIADNPIQRDTERHARKARNSHLASFSEVHKRVHAAITEDGEIYKIDGHTRAFLWKREELERPSEVLVDLYYVSDRDSVINLYKKFDNQAAAETSHDRLSGALSYFEVSGDHRPFMNLGGNSALRILTPNERKLELYDLVEVWKEEIQIFCNIGINQARFRSGIVAAFLATMAGRPQGVKPKYYEVLDFWEKYNSDLGERVGGKDDAVNALDRHLLSNKKAGGGIP